MADVCELLGLGGSCSLSPSLSTPPPSNNKKKRKNRNDNNNNNKEPPKKKRKLNTSNNDCIDVNIKQNISLKKKKIGRKHKIQKLPTGITLKKLDSIDEELEKAFKEKQLHKSENKLFIKKIESNSNNKYNNELMNEINEILY
eukprot:75637_1